MPSAHISQRSPSGCGESRAARIRARTSYAPVMPCPLPSARSRSRSRAHRHGPEAVSARDGRTPVRGLVDSGAGVYDVEMGTALRAAQYCVADSRPHPAVQRGAGKRGAAATAAVPVGEQLVTDPAGQHRGVRHPESADFPGREVGEAGDGMPTDRAAIVVGGRDCSSDSVGITVAVGAASGATTSIEVISGAAARTASSTVSSSVTADDGQLLQLPANSRRTISSTTPSSLTSPPCEPRYGRTLSSASSMRRFTSCGCNPCTSSRLATRLSATNASARAGSAATAMPSIRSSPAP